MTALTGVLEALKDPNINTIGVYGTGGVGKTMLVKEVVAQAQRDKLFDEYPFVVVSQDPNFKKIQREIAEQLNLIFDVKIRVSSEERDDRSSLYRACYRQNG
ncbi:disease resistance protein At4g27190-like [Fagus crenata]